MTSQFAPTGQIYILHFTHIFTIRRHMLVYRKIARLSLKFGSFAINATYTVL